MIRQKVAADVRKKIRNQSLPLVSDINQNVFNSKGYLSKKM